MKEDEEWGEDTHCEYTIVLSPAFSAIRSCSISASIFALGSMSSSPRRQVATVCWLGFLVSWEGAGCLPFWRAGGTFRFSGIGSSLSSSEKSRAFEIRGFTCNDGGR
jgi:hypothetical protein